MNVPNHVASLGYDLLPDFSWSLDRENKLVVLLGHNGFLNKEALIEISKLRCTSIQDYYQKSKKPECLVRLHWFVKPASGEFDEKEFEEKLRRNIKARIAMIGERQRENCSRRYFKGIKIALSILEGETPYKITYNRGCTGAMNEQLIRHSEAYPEAKNVIAPWSWQTPEWEATYFMNNDEKKAYRASVIEAVRECVFPNS